MISAMSDHSCDSRNLHSRSSFDLADQPAPSLSGPPPPRSRCSPSCRWTCGKIGTNKQQENPDELRAKKHKSPSSPSWSKFKQFLLEDDAKLSLKHVRYSNNLLREKEAKEDSRLALMDAYHEYDD